jgi:CTP synthase
VAAGYQPKYLVSTGMSILSNNHVEGQIIESKNLFDRYAGRVMFPIHDVGGRVVGEYQNILFMEANRIMKYRDGRDVLHIHVAYLPTPPSIGEMKSKPAQTSVRLLIGSGIQPDFLIARAEKPVDDRRKETLAWTCNVPAQNIIAAPNVDSIYRVPLNFDQQKLTDKILEKFGMKPKKNDLGKWKNLVNKISKINSSGKAVDIAVVGKYYETGAYKLADVYISVVEAIKHAGWENNVKVNLNWISSLDVEKHGAKKVLAGFRTEHKFLNIVCSEMQHERHASFCPDDSFERLRVRCFVHF